jgi:D-glucosaminate-6-phosphate ammonia-lyase
MSSSRSSAKNPKSGGTRRVTRRQFLGTGTAAGLGALATTGCAAESPGSASGGASELGYGGHANTVASLEDNIYTRLLGVRPHIGAHEHITTLGGSRMPPEVLEAMIEANEYFVDMRELIEAAGARVAELMGAEAAIITSGGSASLLLGSAACLTGTDMDKIEALPDVTWDRRVCLIQEPHRFSYDHAYKTAGMTRVYVESREEFLDRIDDTVAMMPAISAVERGFPIGPPRSPRRSNPTPDSVIQPEEMIRIGKEHGVPVMVDMASDLPPWDNLHRFIDLGADLVVISGGKGILGPQSTGILAGRADLIEAARMQNAPNDYIGRGFKVGKEEIIALVVGLERAVAMDQDAEAARWNERAQWVANQLQDISGVDAHFEMNNGGYGDVDLTLDESVLGFDARELKRRLKEGSPRMVYDGSTVRTRQLRSGEEQLVATRLREVLTGAA